MLTQIQDTLKAVDNNVFYGGVKGLSKAQLWNYIVFARGPLKRSARGNTSYTQTIVVVVVREEYVPEETIAQVIEAMEALPNVRFVDDGGSFEYDPSDI